MIDVKQLTAHAGNFALAAVDLHVAAGELLVLLGPSGAGKTLLLESLLGLRDVDTGTITLDGRDVTHAPPEARLVSYMPQDVALFPHLSVRDNILFGPRVRGTHQRATAQLADLATKLQVTHLLDRPSIRSLSGGERQRVALARALIADPRVVFLDESFSALDADIRHQLLRQLRDLQRALGITMCYVTHNQGEATLIGDRVAVLMQGKLVQLGTPQQVFRQPADLRVAKFVRLGNVLAATGDGNGNYTLDESNHTIVMHAAASDGAPAIQGACWVGFAPQDIVLARADLAPAPPGEPGIEAIVRTVEPHQLRAEATLALRAAPNVTIRCELNVEQRLLPTHQLTAGDAVRIWVPPTAIAAFPTERA